MRTGTAAIIEQETLAAFIGEGHMARHVRRMRSVYAVRRDALLSALRRDFARWLEPIPNIAGLHLSAFADASVDVAALADLARRHDVGVSPLRSFYAGAAARQGLAFGYGAIDERGIIDACARLRRAWPA